MSGHSNSPALDDGRMKRLLGYRLARAAAPGLKVFDQRIGEPLGLRRVEYTILVLAEANAHATQKLLARALSVSVPYLTVTLDRMQERRLLSRVRNEGDRRAYSAGRMGRTMKDERANSSADAS